MLREAVGVTPGAAKTGEERGEMREIETFSPEETFRLGVSLGEEARPGDVYALEGDLGAGKTTLAQGIARGLQVEDPVCSPTFTILQVYEDGRIPLYHFDAYRIESPEEMEEIGYEDYFYGQGLTLVEWAGRIAEILPAGYLSIRMEKDLERGFDYRKVTISEVPG